MKATVLNGSPKGDNSYTLQYVRYLEKAFPEWRFDIINLGQKIKTILKDDTSFQSILTSLADADIVFWVYPVYYLMVPAQLKYFIEKVMQDNTARAYFEGKYTTALSTSAHYYDHTALNYLQGICEDLNMKFLPGFSAATYDLLAYPSDNPLTSFWKTIRIAIQKKHIYPRTCSPLKAPPPLEPVHVDKQNKQASPHICMITDHTSETNANLKTMIHAFCARSCHPVDIINISNENIKGGCLGCMRCAYDGTCIYKDDYTPLFNRTIKSAQTIVYAGTIIDRYLSADFKQYFDRNFFNGHRPIYADKQTLFIISGDLRNNMNLRELLTGQAETWTMEILGFITDEVASTSELIRHIDTMHTLIQSRSQQFWKTPNTFLGIGAKKLFRDLVYEHRGIMNADYQYYKNNRLFDFPNRNLPQQFSSALLRTISKIPAYRKTIQEHLIEQGIKPLQNKIKNVRPAE